MLEPMDFSEMHGKVNLERGKELLERISTANLEKTFELFNSADGGIDGAFYLLYKSLAESGLIQVAIEEKTQEEKIKMTVSILKNIMYNCFVIGAEAFRSVKNIEDLWNLPESIEPIRENDNE